MLIGGRAAKMLGVLKRGNSLLLASVIVAAVSYVEGQQPPVNACFVTHESFALKRGDLSVWELNGGILFTAGMTIDADGAPNAYGPGNRGLDYTANARGPHGWVALITNKRGNPIRQKSGPYRGFYVSTTSLEQSSVKDAASPKRYLDARKVAYIALPRDFAQRFGIALGDLVVVFNENNGRAAYAIYGDAGPRGRIGEGSIALARELGISADPRHGQAPGGIIYLIFPGSGADRWAQITAMRIRSSASMFHQQWMRATTFCYDHSEER